jgi:hypothetical protein
MCAGTSSARSDECCPFVGPPVGRNHQTKKHGNQFQQKTTTTSKNNNLQQTTTQNNDQHNWFVGFILRSSVIPYPLQANEFIFEPPIKQHVRRLVLVMDKHTFGQQKYQLIK